MTNLKPELEISIVTYNSVKWISKFFESLQRQLFPCKSIRVLIQDNGSSDETIRELKKSKSEIGDNFFEFLIHQGGNVGFGRGHNENLKRSAAPFFLVTNIDLEFELNTISELISAARNDSEEVAAWECRQKPFEHPKHYDPVTGYADWCSSACVLFRTSAIKQIGGYEPRLFMYGEDVELSYRLRDRGYHLRYLPKATVWHHTYEHENQVKPLQFLGSTLANLLLRCRYGTWHEILSGFFMYLGLFAIPVRFPGQRLGLIGNGLKILWLAPQFMLTRRRSKAAFPFRMWDYSISRGGAFYRYSNLGVDQEQPLVSVIVRTMPGRSGKLKEAISSLLAQTYARIELVLVEDGGSTADQQVRDFRGSNGLEKVIYLPLPKSGRCLAGNAALKAATGELVCFLDDDDLLYADHLEVLVSEWLKNKSLGAVYGLAYQVRTHIVSHEPWEYEDVEHSLIYQQVFSRPLLWHHNYLPIQTVLFQRALYLKYGGFDEELENLEDWNLWVRYSLENQFLMVPKVTSIYRVPSSADHATDRQQVLDEYYAKAQAKHAKLHLTLSPPQILEIAELLSRQLFVAGVPVSRLRNWVLASPVLRRFYHPLRKLNHLFRRLRQR